MYVCIYIFMLIRESSYWTIVAEMWRFANSILLSPPSVYLADVAFEQSVNFLNFSSRVLQRYDSNLELLRCSNFLNNCKLLSPFLHNKNLQAITPKEKSPFYHSDRVKGVKKKKKNQSCCSVGRSSSSIDRAPVT